MHGLYLEGAAWDTEKGCLMRQKPKQLIQELPVLKIIPIEAHRLKLQVALWSLVCTTRTAYCGLQVVLGCLVFTTHATSNCR